MTVGPAAVVGFWREAGAKAWFKKDDAFDSALRTRFAEAHFAAARRECDDWLGSAEGALALLLLLDQIPRNIFRGSAHQFATDGLARSFADKAIAAGHDSNVEMALRVFFYLPYEHSEEPADQARAVALCEAMGDAEYTRFALLHADIIARFGRFPHRNAMLGRQSTAAELAFLADGGFAG